MAEILTGARTGRLGNARKVDSGVVRVLVAEDDEGLGEALARGLREQGYVVDLVPDGETAAAYLRFYSYEVAVLDWRMPRLSGLDETVRGLGYRIAAS